MSSQTFQKGETEHENTEGVRVIDLDITGMTCASCSNRIEKKLSKLPGVKADVSLVLNQARLTITSDVGVDKLIEEVEQAGYGASVVEDSPSEESSDERTDGITPLRLKVSAFVLVAVMLIEMVDALHFMGWQYVALLLATPVVTWGAWPFHKSALAGLRHKETTMNTLVSLGVTSAYLMSLWALLGDSGMNGSYLEVAVAVTTFMLLGRTLEGKARDGASASVRALAELGVPDALVYTQGIDELPVKLPIGNVRVGDLLSVQPGGKVPTDGVVVSGRSSLDMSLLTGEPVPVDVTMGDEVIGGGINQQGHLVVKATKVGKDTALASIKELVRSAQSGKAPAQRLADQVSAIFVPTVIIIAFVTLLGWIVTGHPFNEAITIAITVLVVACPCALGLATPVALVSGTGHGAKLGILIKGPQVLESARKVNYVVFDKTGTLTKGKLTVSGKHLEGDITETELLNLMGSVESLSAHPIAKAITSHQYAKGGKPLSVENFESSGGLGVKAEVDGKEINIGNLAYLKNLGVNIPDTTSSWITDRNEEGATLVLTAREGKLAGGLSLTDELRETSKQAIRDIKDLGLTPVIISGDNESSVGKAAKDLGVEKWWSGALPKDKVDLVVKLQEQGQVALVGDGVNDVAALTASDLGIAVGGGADAALEAGDITLLRDDPRLVASSIKLSRSTLKVIKQNLAWAFGYNVIAIPVAMTGHATPMVASLAMALSSLTVVLNALRLR